MYIYMSCISLIWTFTDIILTQVLGEQICIHVCSEFVNTHNFGSLIHNYTQSTVSFLFPKFVITGITILR